MNVFHGAALRSRLAIAVLAAGLTVAGCGGNASNAPATSPAPPPAVTSAAPAQAQPAAGAWATSVCQMVTSTLAQLGAPPQANTSNPTATRQAYADYLSRASNAVQQAMDRLASIGAPPVANGQQIFDQLRAQLTQLRNNLNDAATQLTAANANDAAAIGPAFGAAGNAVSLLGTLLSNTELRAAIDQTPECHNVPGMSATTTTPSQPPPT